MRRTLSRLLGIFFAVCASALMLAAVGCSSGNAGSPTPYLPGNLPEAGGTRRHRPRPATNPGDRKLRLAGGNF